MVAEFQTHERLCRVRRVRHIRDHFCIFRKDEVHCNRYKKTRNDSCLYTGLSTSDLIIMSAAINLSRSSSDSIARAFITTYRSFVYIFFCLDFCCFLRVFTMNSHQKYKRVVEVQVQ